MPIPSVSLWVWQTVEVPEQLSYYSLLTHLMMAASLSPYLRHVKLLTSWHGPVIQTIGKCLPPVIYRNSRLNNPILVREKTTSMPVKIKKRLEFNLENQTYPVAKVVRGKGKKAKETKDGKVQSHIEEKSKVTGKKNTHSHNIEAVSNKSVNKNTHSHNIEAVSNKSVNKNTHSHNIKAVSNKSVNKNSKPTSVNCQDQFEPAGTFKRKSNLKPVEQNERTPSQSSKVAGLRYVRKCCPYSPLDQIKVTSDLNEDHTKYKKFIDNLSLSSIPSVTTVINATMSDSARYFLNRWKKQMIEELTEEGFKVHQKKTLDLGKNLHSCIQKYLNGVSLSDLPLETDNKGHWNSLAHVFPDISDVRAVEVEVSHQTLLYHGKFDCVAKYRDTLCVIDWKTSKKAKPLLSNTFDNPIQLAAYLGAINSSRLNVGEEDTKMKQCALVIAYPQGDPAHVHVLDCDQVNTYWHQWLGRLEHYWVLKSNNEVPEWI